jgi:hypothetical protein
MADGFGPRFVLEVAFLVLLALAAGLAELSAAWIVAVMVVGWLLVAIVEWLAWRGERERAREPAGAAEEGLDEPTDWDMEDILAPLPEDEPPA